MESTQSGNGRALLRRWRIARCGVRVNLLFSRHQSLPYMLQFALWSRMHANKCVVPSESRDHRQRKGGSSLSPAKHKNLRNQLGLR